ncbi:hypothetical protein ACIRBX_23825 [Kitasatospora sp. NPDC096147]|uniref:hypothetical protein n=1 Tax=Kitasatospora sp. NPDC096147 TaxID=3364093 RepID=UPI00380E48A3
MAPVRIDTARAAARHWITTEGRAHPGYLGAYLTGSTTTLPDGAELPVGSDLDIVLVTREEPEGFKLGKFEHQGVLLEVSQLGWEQLGPAERVLTDHHLAPGLRHGIVVDDPGGAVGALQGEVAARFAEPEWIRARCRNVHEKITAGLAHHDPEQPWHRQVSGWLFPTGITTHLVLVAALRNPTVRLRYLRAREVLAELGLSAHYPGLLRLLGADELTPGQVRHHLDTLAVTFDETVVAARTPFPFSTDISPQARPIAIDAAHHLVARGDHREAMFWTVATFARCHAVLAVDAPAAHERLTPHFTAAVADLGINTTSDLLARRQATLAALPGLRDLTERIITTGPGPDRPAARRRSRS